MTKQTKQHDFEGALGDMPRLASKKYSRLIEYHSDVLNWFDDNEETIQLALRFADRLTKILSQIEDECESEMSRAEHRKKIAEMDYHQSEINHQEGRWHCANDLHDFVKAMAQKLIEEEGDAYNT